MTQDKEITALMPTEKWRDAQSLLSYVEEEEQMVIIPILGTELFDVLEQAYRKAVVKYGGITPDLYPVDEVDGSVRLIRICQKIQFYLAISNNIGLFSVSMNRGGGFNVASSDNYERADKESLDRLEKDSFRKAHRSIDTLLMELERDAKKTKPSFAELWKKSRYFYLKADLLITTADDLQNYLNIGASRERYIELDPDLRYAQNTYLRPSIGSELMQAFVERNRTAIPPAEDADAEKRRLWDEADSRLRAALAGYAEHRNVKLRRPDSLAEADMSLAQAIELMKSNQSAFEPYIKSSPFYTEAVQHGKEEGSDPRCICGEPAKFDPCDPNNAITVLRPTLFRY